MQADETYLQDLIDEKRSSVLTLYMEVVGWTLYLYDYLDTLEAEVQFVWGHQWALGKILFLLNRYYTHLDNAYGVALVSIYWTSRYEFDRNSFALNVVDNVSALVLPYLQIAIILLCVHGLLGATKTWKIAGITVYVIMLAISSTLMINHLARQRKESYDDYSIFRIVGNYWVFLRTVALFLLGVIALYTRYRGYRSGFESRRSLLSILRRDGLLCYIGILGTTLWACIVDTPGYPRRLRMFTYSAGVCRSITAILANRLIINLRKNASGQETQADYEMTATGMQFAENPCTSGDATVCEQRRVPRLKS